MHERLEETARRALAAVLAVQPGERLLVITDEVKAPIGQAFRAAALQLGAEASLHLLDEAERPLVGVPADLVRELAEVEVAMNCFAARAEETPFRVALLKALLERPVRVGHAPGITEEMMLSGPLDIDYAAVKERAVALVEALRHASYVRVTAPGGTDLTLYIEGRAWDTDLAIAPGSFGNLPCGEIWCAPVETLGEGVLVCDGSIGDLGAVRSPVTLTVDNGRLAGVSCEDGEFLGRLERLLSIDEGARVVGELGIGINPRARIVGNLLEDEKAFRTAHVAFGNNQMMPGGRNRSATHRDFLFRDPTIVVHRVDGSAVRIVEDGLAAV